ncbi:FAD-dependent monooxygenase [Tropicimonas sp. S265A]|uniref:FAD-dependent monooxygenase n=1 Tax=Tropicimonas sp. S265A TaxID=3415134 RepID=UPI003C7E7BB6
MVLLGREITVLGAGIGGLTAALCFAARGAQVRVLEQSDAIREVGAGLQISPNGARVLAALGLSDALISRAVRSEAVVLRDYSDGEEVLRMPLGADPGFHLIHRADLIDMLAAAARTAGVAVELGRKVDQVVFSDSEAVSLRFADGTCEPVSMLVGADGLHSPVRRALDKPAQPFFTGQVAWRMVLPQTQFPEPCAQVFMGPGRHLVTYPLRGGTERNIVAVEERDRWTAEGWSHRDDPMRVARAFAGFPPRVRGWLESARDVHVWGLFRHEVAPVWHRGASVILGDAAHPTLPFLAQGANLAIEDAWVLASCMSDSADDAEAFARYQVMRQARTARAVAAANANAKAYHLPEGPVRTMAHIALRMLNRTSPTMPLRKFDWLYNTDVTAS